MPTQRFDVSILLNVLTKGSEQFDEITSAIKRLTKAGEIASQALSKDFFGQDLTNRTIDRIEKVVKSFEKLKDVDIGGGKSFAAITNRLEEIRQKAEKGIFINVNTDIKELEIYLKRLNDIRDAAEKLDDRQLFTGISAEIDAAKALKSQLEQASKVSLQKNIAVYKELLDEVNLKVKDSLRQAELLSRVGAPIEDVKKYANELIEARKNLAFLSKEAKNLGQSTVGIDASIGKVSQAIKKLQTGKPLEIGTTQKLDEIINQLESFEQKAKAGIPINFNIQQAQLDTLAKKLVDLRKKAADIGDVETFQDATLQLNTIENVRADLDRISKIPLDRSAAKFKFELNQISKELKEVTKRGQNLVETGADVSELKNIESELQEIIRKLVETRKTAESLGKDTTQINIKIRDAQASINLLKTFNAEKVAAKREAINLQVRNQQDLKDAIKNLQALNKELDKAVERRDFKAIPDLRRRINEVRAQQQELIPKIQNSGKKAQVTAFTGFTEGLDKAESKLKQFSAEGGSGAVLAFNRVGASFRNAFRDAGGTNAAIRAVSGSLRLVGTSAFVVGGELRTLGFGFSALGSLVQNFGPLLVSLTSSFGLLAIPLIAISGYLFTLTAQFLAFSGVLAAVAKVGLQFNDEFARTRNSISGIVGLFFDVTKNGRDAGDGLEGVAAAQARLAATSVLVTAELKQLSQEALTTEFTTSELFAAFNAAVTSGAKLAPNLQTLTILTGGLARVSSVAGVSAANLGSSITQLISGTGRVTNPLQRFFNQIKDSKGVELTADRIRKLRKEGTLLGELLRVTNKFSALGEEQSKTLTGSFSNIVDAFELFAGEATQKAYDTLRIGFTGIKDLITEQVDATVVNNQGKIEKIFDASGNAVKITKFKEPILKLAEIFNELFNTIAKDFVSLLNYVGQKIVDFANYLSKNGQLLINIYTIVKNIGLEFLRILDDVYELIKFITKANTGLEAIRNILNEVYLAIIETRQAYFEIYKAILLIGLAIEAFLVKPTNNWLDILTLGFYNFEAAADDTIATIIKKLKEVDGELDLISERKNDLKFSQLLADDPQTQLLTRVFGGEPVGENDTKKQLDFYDLIKNKFSATDTEEKKSSRDKTKSLLADRKQLAEAIISLSKTTEEVQLNALKTGLDRQRQLLDVQRDFEVTSQEQVTARILDLKNKESLADIKVKRNDIARAKERQRLLEVGFAKEEALIRKQVKKPNELSGKLSEVEINRQTARIKNTEEIRKLEGEILAIKGQQLEFELEAVNAQFNRIQELIKQNRDLKTSLGDLFDKTSAESLANTQRSVVESQIDEIRKLDTAIRNINAVAFINLAKTGGVGSALEKQRNLLVENRDLLEKQLQIRIQLARYDFVQGVFQSRQNELRLREDEIQQDVATGLISEREAAIRTAVVRKQIVESLKLANDELKKSGLLTKEQNLQFEQNNLEIRRLSEELPDSGIVDATRQIGDGFTTLFENLQEDIGSAKSAFGSLAQTILGTFRRLIAQRLSEALFEKILAPNGKVAKVFEDLGLSRQKDINTEASARAASQENPLLKETQDSLNTESKDFKTILEQINKDFDDKTKVFKDALDDLASKINKTTNDIEAFNPRKAEIDAQQAAAFNVLNESSLNLRLFGIDLNLAVNTLKDIINSLLTSGSVSSSYDLQIPQEKNGGFIKYFANGGAAKGKDVIPAYLSNGEFVLSPEIVKMIGLPVLNYINKYGKIPAMAGGGSLFQSFGNAGASSFSSNLSFLGGGAKAIKKLDPIIEKVVQPVKKKGGLRSLFGNILSFAAPFLNFIPGIGPFLALGAGAAGGALTGSTKGKLGGILGGIFGGLSNLGGFSKSGGFLGSLSRGVGSPTGQVGLSLFSGLLGNVGGSLGNASLDIFKSGKLQSLFGNLKGLSGNFLKKILGFFDVFKFGSRFDLSSILSKSDGGLIPKLAGGGQADIGKLLALLGAVTSISSIFNNSSSGSDYVEEIVDDPDAARKNFFGSAYGALIDANFIPDFQYSDSTLQKLRNQFSGIKNLVKVPKTGILSKLGSILPAIIGLFNLKGISSGASKSGTTDILKNFAATGAASFSSGGFANYLSGGKVKGAGTSTSDSILSLIKPESFVMKASSAKALEDMLLESINSQVFSFADGGTASNKLINLLPDLAPNVNASSNVSIHNYTDLESAIDGYLSSPKNSKRILNVLDKNRNAVSTIARRGKVRR